MHQREFNFSKRELEEDQKSDLESKRLLIVSNESIKEMIQSDLEFDFTIFSINKESVLERVISQVMSSDK